MILALACDPELRAANSDSLLATLPDAACVFTRREGVRSVTRQDCHRSSQRQQRRCERWISSHSSLERGKSRGTVRQGIAQPDSTTYFEQHSLEDKFYQ
jgi:hypothetical protein